MGILNHIYEMAQKDTIALNRFKTAESLNSTMMYLSNKKWIPSQLPFVEALVKLIEIEKTQLIELGLYELAHNHPDFQQEKDDNSSQE
jgi:hypothetical protein